MTKGLGGDFCLICGSDPPLYADRMCEPCTRARTRIAEVPENTNFTRCARCGLIDMHGRWVDVPEDKLWDELIQRNVAFHERAEEIGLACQSQTVSDRHTLLHLQIEGVVDDLLYKDEFTMRARMSNGVCLTCTRRAGNYFEATVQLRSTGRRLEEDELNTLRASLDDVIENLSDDPMFFITSEGSVTGGYDVVLGSKGLARSWGRHLTDNWGGQVGETNTTVGRKDGVDVTRLTLLYRKPGYDLGDVVRWRGDYWRPSSWSKDGAIMERIARQERTGATWRDLDNVLVIAQMKNHLTVDVLNKDDSVAEFLNPESWKMTSVRLPWDYDGAATLRLANVEGEFLALHDMALDHTN